MKKLFFALVIFSPFNLFSQDRITGEMFSTRSEVISQNGMVATSHPLASQIGIDILQNGGNAIDAAVGIQATLGLVEPQSSGLGGGGFLNLQIRKQCQVNCLSFAIS